MKLIEIIEQPIGNFSNPMIITKLGPFVGKRWNIGRLGTISLGLRTPLGEVLLTSYDLPAETNSILITKIESHMNLNIGKRLSLRLF